MPFWATRWDQINSGFFLSFHEITLLLLFCDRLSTDNNFERKKLIYLPSAVGLSQGKP